jgi:hypothetical protein
MIALLSTWAWAGSLYINGTLVEPRSLGNVSLQGATVRFDGQGNIYVDAPGYRVQAVGVAAPAPAPAPKPAPSPVAYGRWWLVTEDRGSSGHSVEVWINGALAQTVRSGGGDQLIELSRHLKLGPNDIRIRSFSTEPAGGSLTLFIGPGGSEKGYFDMPLPPVEFGLSSTRSGTYERQYTLSVDR